MQTDDTYGKVRPRKPSFRGHAYAYIAKGEVRVAAWPTRRKKGHRSELNDEQEWFRQAQWASKYWPAEIQAQCAAAVKGTPLMPRDIMTMIMAGRAFMWVDEQGRKVYPIVARNDVSESLDIISQTPGTMLFRAKDWWVPIPPGTLNWVLTYKDDETPPEWLPVGGAGGGANWVLVTKWDFATDGTTPYVESADLSPYSQVMVVGRSVSASAAGWRVAMLSDDGGANYYSAAGDYTTLANTGVPTNTQYIFGHSTSNANARSFFFTIEKINQLAPVRCVNNGVFGPQMFLASSLPIDRLRVLNATAPGGVPAGVLNGGFIEIYAR